MLPQPSTLSHTITFQKKMMTGSASSGRMIAVYQRPCSAMRMSRPAFCASTSARIASFVTSVRRRSLSVRASARLSLVSSIRPTVPLETKDSNQAPSLNSMPMAHAPVSRPRRTARTVWSTALRERNHSSSEMPMTAAKNSHGPAASRSSLKGERAESASPDCKPEELSHGAETGR